MELLAVLPFATGLLGVVYFANEVRRCVWGDLRFMRSAWPFAAMLGAFVLLAGIGGGALILHVAR